MKKIFTLIAIAGLLFTACTKEEASGYEANGDNGAVVFTFNNAGSMLQQAPSGVRNAAGAQSLGTFAMTDIHAYMFNAYTGVLSKDKDITAAIDWAKAEDPSTDWNGTWSGAALTYTVGTYTSLVVFNKAAMNTVTEGTTNLSAVSFEIAPAAKIATGVITDKSAIYEVATSVATLPVYVTSKDTAETADVVKRINTKIQINMGFDSTTMFDGFPAGKICVSSIEIAGVRKTVKFDGTKVGSDVVTIKTDYTDGAHLITKTNATKSDDVTFANANMFGTLAYPFAVGELTYTIKLKYTTDGTTWVNLVLKDYVNTAAVSRNQITNLNVFVKSLKGDVTYDLTFKDWEDGASEGHDFDEE